MWREKQHRVFVFCTHVFEELFEIQSYVCVCVSRKLSYSILSTRALHVMTDENGLSIEEE